MTTAQKERNDEFYTQIDDIADELFEYRQRDRVQGQALPRYARAMEPLKIRVAD